MIHDSEQEPRTSAHDSPGVDVHTYAPQPSSEDRRRASRSMRSCLILIAVNVLHHFLLLTWGHLGDSFIVFEDWYRVAACFAPPLATITIALVLLVERWCSALSALIAVAFSTLLAVMHWILIDLAAAIV